MSPSAVRLSAALWAGVRVPAILLHLYNNTFAKTEMRQGG